MIPQVIPAVIDEPPLPTGAHSAAQGHGLPVRAAAGAGSRLRLLPGAGPDARSLAGLLGPGNPHRHAAAGANYRHGRAEQRRPDLVQLRSRSEDAFRSSSSTSRRASCTIGLPIPDITPMNPPLGLVPPLPPKVEHLSDTGHLTPGLAMMRGLAYVAQHSDSVFGNGTLDVAKYGRVLKSRQLVGVRGAGLPYDGLYYVKQRDARHPARRLQANLLARAQRPVLHAAGGADMSDKRFHGIYRGRCREQHRPGRTWPHPGVGGRRGRQVDPELGHAVPAGDGHEHGHVHRCRRKAPACGCSSSAAIPTTRCG